LFLKLGTGKRKEKKREARKKKQREEKHSSLAPAPPSTSPSSTLRSPRFTSSPPSRGGLPLGLPRGRQVRDPLEHRRVPEHLRDNQKADAASADENVVEVGDAAVPRGRGHVAELEVPAVFGLGEVSAEGLAGLELDLEEGNWWRLVVFCVCVCGGGGGEGERKRRGGRRTTTNDDNGGPKKRAISSLASLLLHHLLAAKKLETKLPISESASRAQIHVSSPL